jgi:hypothetical protein
MHPKPDPASLPHRKLRIPQPRKHCLLLTGLGVLLLVSVGAILLLRIPQAATELPAAQQELPPLASASPVARQVPSPTLSATAKALTPTETPSVHPTHAQVPPSPLPTLAVPTLPALEQGSAAGLPFFGISLERATTQQALALAQEAGLGTLRLGALSWQEVEPIRTDPPTYQWAAMAELETQLVDATQAGLEVILVVMFTPDWAQAVAGHSCGAIQADAHASFAQFLSAAVARYGAPPYHVRFWELWNEPDVDPSLVPADSVFGCWGNHNDETYGGTEYGAMLAHAYPAIKQADPQAQVVLGGLLLDAPNTLPSTFLNGVLQVGGGEHFDMLAFHAYTSYSPQVYDWDNLPGTKWIDQGGVVRGKADFLRDTLRRYGYDKPLILNEAGLAWWSSEKPTREYRQAQADYLVQLYTRGLALELLNVSWYSWEGPGWRQMGLLNRDLSLRPAYHALAFASQELAGAEYVGPVQDPAIEGYHFRRDKDQLQVLWSNDGQEHEVLLPTARFVAALDLFGQPATVERRGDEVSVIVRRPVYVRLSP